MPDVPPPTSTPADITLSAPLFNKIVNVLAELPFNRVGGLIGEIQQELNTAMQAQQRASTVASLLRANAGSKPEAEPPERRN